MIGAQQEREGPQRAPQEREGPQRARPPREGTPPGGARRERREHTRAALLQAAQRLWAERGVHGASLDDVAAAAGLTKGAVYSNFTGKTDLLLALLEHYTHARFGTEVHELLHETDQPVAERLRRAGEGYRHRLGTEDARLLALLLVEFWLYGMRDYAAGWRLAEWYEERRGRLARHLPDVDGVPAADRAALAMAMDFGLAAQHLLDPDRVPADLYATGLDLILGPALRQPRSM
ncbi:DNA-binding transcriptional regulator, AcrR family [Thermomonospora echinospora]|uniref:DNA-binding transcriptional regulator, AcrR family n=1 Tax=Thermomonospora echinospora TaxID=1992 RepID=A0A1H5ZDG9_9ACTN|nr:TetR/AcrR family transcriptional regulator [Thermomonospora echinospora]SEG34110.1 DNA-binding transcriptional regulator, AcrR family [Thermomonospora echinospora]